jgi:hypothetical protein
MKADRVRDLLERIGGIRHPCDLDLLVFFHRHPRALLSSEQLVTYAGYERDQVAKSLDGLIEAGLLVRSQHPAHAARLYVLDLHAGPGGSLESLLKFAATREGRRVVMQLLEEGPKSIPSARATLALRRVV